MYLLCILIAFEVTALLSTSIRKIDLYSNYNWENKLQALTKMDETHEWSDTQARNLHHRVCHKLRNGLLGKLFLLLYCVTTNKVEIHEETSITSNRFNVT